MSLTKKQLKMGLIPMKRANTHLCKYGILAGFGKITTEDTASMDANIKTGYHGQPCPAYQRTNNNANIKRIRARIRRLGI
jgi:hypothetical protein